MPLLGTVVEYSNPRRFLYPYLYPYLLSRLVNRLLKNVRNSACNSAVIDFLAIQQSFKLHRELFLEKFTKGCNIALPVKLIERKTVRDLTKRRNGHSE